MKSDMNIFLASKHTGIKNYTGVIGCNYLNKKAVGFVSESEQVRKNLQPVFNYFFGKLVRA